MAAKKKHIYLFLKFKIKNLKLDKKILYFFDVLNIQSNEREKKNYKKNE
jgi:hypothetical protein